MNPIHVSSVINLCIQIILVVVSTDKDLGMKEQDQFVKIAVQEKAVRNATLNEKELLILLRELKMYRNKCLAGCNELRGKTC